MKKSAAKPGRPTSPEKEKPRGGEKQRHRPKRVRIMIFKGSVNRRCKNLLSQPRQEKLGQGEVIKEVPARKAKITIFRGQ